jgi:hypothetical protein
MSARTFWHSPIGRAVNWVLRKVFHLKSNHEQPFD